MTGYTQFVEVFGDITLAHVATVIFAFVFLFLAYRKFSAYLFKKHDAEQAQAERVNKALEAVDHLPEYRKQSLDIQEAFRMEFEEMRKVQAETIARLDRMEEVNTKRERNRTRDKLLQLYRYYTNPESNPSKSWTRMESEAFWEIFGDYEEAGGDGYMHTVVQPAMNALNIIDVYEHY